MKQPLQIVFRGIAPSPALDAAARLKAGKLDRVCRELISCRITIELLDGHPHLGRQFAVAIGLRFPNHGLSVNRVRSEDAYVAMRDAFDDMRRMVDTAMGPSHPRGAAPGGGPEGGLVPG